MFLRPVLGSLAVIAVAATATGGATAGPLQRGTLCMAGEQIIYSCRVKQSVVSICAAPRLATKSDYVQYRFAKAGRLQMSYPSDKVGSRKLFIRGSRDFPSGIEQYIRFQKGGYDYVVYSYFAVDSPGADGLKTPIEGSGLVVQRAGKMVSQLTCRLDGEIDPSASAGIPMEAFDESRIPGPR